MEEFGDALERNGFARHGGESMISGITGEEFAVDIFVGPVYYQRLRHMVSDKFQVLYRRSLWDVIPGVSDQSPHCLDLNRRSCGQ